MNISFSFLQGWVQAMSKYNIFVVSPSNLSSVIKDLETPQVDNHSISDSTATSDISKATHQCLAHSHKIELARLIQSSKVIFKFYDLKQHLRQIEDLPVHSQALSAYLYKNNYVPQKIKNLKGSSATTLWKHKNNSLFS
jgi:hypothetical protein